MSGLLAVLQAAVSELQRDDPDMPLVIESVRAALEIAESQTLGDEMLSAALSDIARRRTGP